MARGTSIKRIREYFKLGDIDEVEVVLQLVQGDVSKRQCVVSQPALPFHKGKRKPRAKKVVMDAEPLRTAMEVPV